MKKPVIGIAAKHDPAFDAGRADTFIRDEVKQAVFDNGGIAVGLLPPEAGVHYCDDAWENEFTPQEEENLYAQIGLCDGIILQGGYEKDYYENLIARYCYERDIPILGICAGQNNLVRALGGTTYRIPNPEQHSRPDEKYVHNIQIKKGSRFHKIVGTDEMKVNSRHIRTIGQCPLLEKAALCEDGYPDVVEAKEKRFYLGVRFHPESLYLEDPYMNRIFQAFLAECQKKV